MMASGTAQRPMNRSLLYMRRDPETVISAGRMCRGNRAESEGILGALRQVFGAGRSAAGGDRWTGSRMQKLTMDTLNTMTQRTEAAEDLTNSNKAALEQRMENIEARQDANVSASTDSSADYAAEMVDARVDRYRTDF